MNRQLAAKKSTGLSDLFKGYTPQQLEEQHKPIVAESRILALQKVFQTYDQHIDSFPYIYPDDRTPFIRQKGYRLSSYQYQQQKMMKRRDRTLKLKDDPCYKIRLDDILTPAEINTFVQYKIYQDPHTHAGLFLSKLIQNSYHAGFNNFEINIPPLDVLIGCVAHLEGNSKKPLVIGVHGTVKYFALSLSYVQATFHGKANEIGDNVSHSSITVHGDVPEDACSNSLDSMFIFHGKMINIEDLQEKIPGDLKGRKWEFLYDRVPPANCTFKTSDQETLEKIRRNIPGRRSDPLKLGNKIIFIHPDGREETVRDFDDA